MRILLRVPSAILLLGLLAAGCRNGKGDASPAAGRAQTAPAPAGGGLYGQRIVYEVREREKTTRTDKYYSCIVAPRDTAAELAGWLGRITGKPFEVSGTSNGSPTRAIYLLPVDSPLVAQSDRARLQDKGLEAFLIRGDADKLQIVANDLRGLTHGAYTYLEWLGVRWLMAGANWTVVPSRADITLKVERVMEPAFFTRTYYGTGGYASYVTGRGPEFMEEWSTWSLHMRNGGQGLGKAMGEAFISDPKIERVLKAHPEYLAKIDGVRTQLFIPPFQGAGRGAYVWNAATNDYVKATPPGTGTHDLNEIVKLNAGNPAAVELYANWILERLRDVRKEPQGYAIQTISVEPSDGGGEGNNYDELKAQGVGDGSESDQEFFIGNACARKVRAEFPDVSVIMLAYASRSDPPTFELEPNFIVQPALALRWGRKTAGLSNEEWLGIWKRKAQRMAVYDYWSIPDWDHDQPTFNYLDMANKLRDLHRNNIRAINAESTFSGGAMAIGQYLASHLMWDINLDEKALLEDWYDHAFGPAKAPMKRMLERWARGYRPISAELGIAYADIAEAERLAEGHPAFLARVHDYARYLHYLRLYNEFLSAADDADKGKRGLAICEYLLNITDSRMVHTARIFDLLVFRDNVKAASTEFHRHDASDANDPPDGPGWARIHPLSHEDVAALIADGLKTYPRPDFDIRSYAGKLVPLKPVAWKAPEGDPWGVVMAVASAEVTLQMPKGLAAFPLRVSRIQDNKVSIQDDAGRTVFSRAVTKADGDTIIKWTWDEMSVPCAPGRYRLRFEGKEGRAGTFLFQTWKDIPMVLQTFQTQKPFPSPRLYFYVPRGVPKVAMYFPYSFRAGAFETPMYGPDGNRVKVDERDGGKLVVAAVPAGMDGQVWSMERLVQPNEDFQTLTVPQAFSLEPQALMVPEDAL